MGIKCGTAAFLCYAQYTGKASLQFVAKPDPGYRFVNWGGACFGQQATCTLTVGGARSLRANFAPVNPGATAKVTLDPPHVSVHWHQSVGSGQLVVSGTVSKPALLKLEFRRPAGGPLLTQQESVLAGRFSIKPALSAASLPKGAALLPGGFVLVLKGRVGSTALPQSLRTIVLPPPLEGVVRRAFTSRTATGKPTPRIRFGAKSASCTFVSRRSRTLGRSCRSSGMTKTGESSRSDRSRTGPPCRRESLRTAHCPRADGASNAAWRSRHRNARNRRHVTQHAQAGRPSSTGVYDPVATAKGRLIPGFREQISRACRPRCHRLDCTAGTLGRCDSTTSRPDRLRGRRSSPARARANLLFRSRFLVGHCVGLWPVVHIDELVVGARESAIGWPIIVLVERTGRIVRLWRKGRA